jgi:hypothetical protein
MVLELVRNKVATVPKIVELPSYPTKLLSQIQVDFITPELLKCRSSGVVKKSELSQSSGPGFHSCHRSEVVKTLAYIRVV